MDTIPPQEVTHLLNRWGEGDANALNELFPLVESHLRLIARKRIRKTGKPNGMDTVGLVGELYIKLTGDKKMNVDNRGHFFRIAAVIMRHALIDHIRGQGAQKRGIDREVSPPTEGLDNFPELKKQSPEQLLALDDALDKLEKLNPNHSRVVEMRYFLGMTYKEIARIERVDERTIRRKLEQIITWLKREMT